VFKGIYVLGSGNVCGSIIADVLWLGFNLGESMSVNQSDYQKLIEAAAEEQANGARSAINYMTKWENYYEGFSMGASFVQANPPPEVLALVDAVKAAEIMFDKFLEEQAIKNKEPGILMNENPFSDALANFQKTRGGE